MSGWMGKLQTRSLGQIGPGHSGCYRPSQGVQCTEERIPIRRMNKSRLSEGVLEECARFSKNECTDLFKTNKAGFVRINWVSADLDPPFNEQDDPGRIPARSGSQGLKTCKGINSCSHQTIMFYIPTLTLQYLNHSCCLPPCWGCRHRLLWCWYPGWLRQSQGRWAC
jgi:hypothetical protein